MRNVTLAQCLNGFLKSVEKGEEDMANYCLNTMVTSHHISAN